MPIFEYICDNCGHEFETLQKVSEAPLKKCEACGAKKLRKKISAAGFRLSGSGWYETDFKSGKKKNVSSSDEKSGADSSSGSSKDKDSGGSTSKKESTSTSEKATNKSSKSSKTGGDN